MKQINAVKKQKQKKVICPNTLKKRELKQKNVLKNPENFEDVRFLLRDDDKVETNNSTKTENGLNQQSIFLHPLSLRENL